MKSINTLPDDVLFEIFHMHVSGDAVQRLLLVCRRWYTVATSISSLWTNLLLYDGPVESSIIPKYEKVEVTDKIICRSAPALASAIQRIRGNKFELTVIKNPMYGPSTEEQWKILDPLMFSKCRVLRLPGHDNARTVHYLKNLPALEELHIYSDIHQWDHSPIPSLLDKIQETSKGFRYLDISSRAMPSLQTYKTLLARLDKFHMCLTHVDQHPFPFYIATSLTTLSVDAFSVSHLVKRELFDCPSPFLHTLHLKGHWKILSTSICAKIKHLSVEAYGILRRDSESADFPNLVHLTIHEDWMAMIGIQAPNLHTLKLIEQSFGLNRYSLRDLGSVTLRPLKLDIDWTLPEHRINDLPGGLLSGLEDLQLVYKGLEASLWRPLAAALKGNTNEKPLCPGLFRLVILSAKRSPERQEKSEKLLQDIVKGRTKSRRLREARYGWYGPPSGSRNVDPRDSRDMVWTNFV